MSFRTTLPLRFAHCDHAGIAYYPRLLELVDAAIEDWTAATLGLDRAAMHGERGLGLPTVELRTRFERPCRLGEMLDLDVAVRAVGGSSVELGVTASVKGSPRFTAELTQVLMRLDTAAAEPWPEGWRARLHAAAGKRAA